MSPFVPSIAVILDATAIALEQGETGTVAVTVARGGGFSGAVALAVTEVPDEVAAALNPLSLSGSGTSTLTLTADPAAALGTYEVIITGTGSGVASRSATLSVTITSPPLSPSIGITLGSSALSLVQGQSGTVSVDVSRSGGYSGAVTFSISGQPAGVTAAFNPASVSGTTGSVLTLSAAATTAPGTYTISVTGSGTGVSNASAALTLTVSAAPPSQSIGLLVRADNNEVWVVQGQSKTWEVIVTRNGGFAGTVDLTSEGLPSGVTAQFVPPAIDANTAGGALIFTATAGAAEGTTNVTIRARAAGVPDATLVVRLEVFSSAP
ncbi:MAG TPA: hypothetical protein VMM18_01100 [Gemmatimonadaceae bacterium]|nr:hypothetical protein [Gemmatimonadaceae bacterium]